MGKRLQRRVSYCCLVLPLFFAFCLSGMSVITLAIKNLEVKGKCQHIPCILGSDSGPTHANRNCRIALGGGGAVCVAAVFLMLSLILRMCYGAKWYLWCAVLEVVFLMVVFGVAALAGAIFTFGVEASIISLKTAITNCSSEEVHEQDVIDFMRQSEVSAWLSCICVFLVLVMWIAMAKRFGVCTSKRAVRVGHGEDGSESDRLIND